ncbi:MAG: diaminopimelate epimerase [Rhodospirillales bacterium]|nr:diaminopimelate epimerase [Rhodospirillales bacterium]
MHGLGNDFVVLDGRKDSLPLSPEAIARLADRHFGIGCDQVIVLEPPSQPDADLGARFYNSDGSESGACGNGSRCVVHLWMAETGKSTAQLETAAGLLACEAQADGRVTVDMGPARLDWTEIPLARALDTLHLPIDAGPLVDPVAVGMGNPHAVFFVPDLAAIDLAALGPVVEHHPLFPERANVEIVQVLSQGVVRMRVWERGSGITLACGTGACAAAVAAARRGHTGRRVRVILDGGPLDVAWHEDGRVRMTGPVATTFEGRLGPDLFE